MSQLDTTIGCKYRVSQTWNKWTLVHPPTLSTVAVYSFKTDLQGNHVINCVVVFSCWTAEGHCRPNRVEKSLGVGSLRPYPGPKEIAINQAIDQWWWKIKCHISVRLLEHFTAKNEYEKSYRYCRCVHGRMTVFSDDLSTVKKILQRLTGTITSLGHYVDPGNWLDCMFWQIKAGALEYGVGDVKRNPKRTRSMMNWVAGD